jgi:hypothetical protein
MVTNTRRATRPGAIRSLNLPQPVKVVESHSGSPLRVANLGVREVIDRWRLYARWWREEAIDREYFECLLEDCRRVTLMKDLLAQVWYQQRA